MTASLSVLDLVPVREGDTPAQALRLSMELAQHCERFGYRRYWVAEHHNMTGIASAATSVVIGFLAGATRSIRVGAGGIMLPNHSPLVIAEQFGTLESLYPGRIDLGLGRAPGTDQVAMLAMRRDPAASENFVQDVLEVQAFFAPAQPGQRIRAVPGEGLDVPLWILGSSLYGAQVAAHLGLPYAFASHFAPDALDDAIEVYRARFRPSAQQSRPYVMPGINVVAAATDQEAQRLFTSLQMRFLGMIRNARGKLGAPVDDIDQRWSAAEKAQVSRMLRCSFVGSAETIRRELSAFVARTGADELVVSSAIWDPAARIRSYEILASVADQLGLGTSLLEAASA
jgi:luciferase family oxidoreductase group 1